MSGERDDFLSRWSRRKRESERTGDPRAEPEPSANQPEPDGRSDETELSPEEIAALPKIEELAADSDITVFLRKGVPDMLRNAALRRMWSLDPAIRDYVGDARDYGYDWNVPGGVPGNGPMLASDDVEQMVRRIFGEEPPTPPDDADAVVRDGPAGAGAEPLEERQNGAVEAGSSSGETVTAVQHNALDEPDPASLSVRLSGPEPPPLKESEDSHADAAPRSSTEVEARSPVVRRRHGGAMPV